MKISTKNSNNKKLEIMESMHEKFNSNFNNWSQWGDYSTTCGEGTRTRTRTCPGPYECIGEDSETVTCPNNPTCTTIHLENIQAFQECTDDPSVVNCKLLTKNGYCSKDEL